MVKVLVGTRQRYAATVGNAQFSYFGEVSRTPNAPPPPPGPAPVPRPPRQSLYPTRSAAGSTLGSLLVSQGYVSCLLLGVTPEGVEIAANAAKAMGASFDVIVSAFIRLGSNLAPIGALAETDTSTEMDPEFEPGANLIDKLGSAIEESRARVRRDLVLYRTQRPIKKFEGRQIIVIDGQVFYPWKVLAAARAVSELGGKRIAIATPVASALAADRIRARLYEFVCPNVLAELESQPSLYGDAVGDSPERLKSIMIAHQAA
jgi:putative phosphoribosyl transferase